MIKKKFLILGLLVAAINCKVLGQNEIGFKFGFGYSNIYNENKHREYLLMNDTLGLKYNHELGRSINFGVLFNKQLNDKISILTGANYMFKLQNYRIVYESYNLRSENGLIVNYINLPILARIQSKDQYLKYYAHGGLYINTLISASISEVSYYGSSSSINASYEGAKLNNSNINFIDFGISFGGGIKLVKVGAGSLIFDFNINHGIPRILKYNIKGVTRNFDLNFSAGYIIYLKNKTESNR